MSSVTQAALKLPPAPLSDFKAAYAVASAEIYKDIEVKILITELCLSNVALAVRYRAEVFGDDVNAVGDYIGTALSGSDMLMHNVEDLLEFAGYFDLSPERAARAESYRIKAAECSASVSTTLSHVISIADMDVVPDFFLEGEPVAEPKKLLSRRMSGLAVEMTNMLARHDLRMGMLENLAESAEGLAKKMPSEVKILKAEAENIQAIHKKLQLRRIEIETFAERLQPNPFA